MEKDINWWDILGICLQLSLVIVGALLIKNVVELIILGNKIEAELELIKPLL